jgi:hypothetical protein
MAENKLQEQDGVRQAIDRLTAAVLAAAMETLSTDRQSEVVSDQVTRRVMNTYEIALHRLYRSASDDS